MQQNVWLKKSERLSVDCLIGVSLSLLLGIISWISLPLPFTPVPLVFQNSVALFLAALVGPRAGGIMLLSFLLQGALGFPVFALGASSVATLIGPRGGYLIGYLVGGVLAGFLYQISQKRKRDLFFSMAAGNMVIFVLGALWLSNFVGIKGAWTLGVYPFWIGDVLKLALLTMLPSTLQVFPKWLGR